MHTLQANDLDIMIQWIKFFKQPKDQEKYLIYKEIIDKETKEDRKKFIVDRI